MRIDLNKGINNETGMAGMGPSAWDRDTQKMSMHPPIPGHIEFVEEHMERHNHDHHTVHRNHPENDDVEELVQKEIPLLYLLPLLAGKEYVSNKIYHLYHNEHSTSSDVERVS